MQQIVVYPKDAAILLGISLKTAQGKIRAIKEKYKLQKNQCVSVENFCEFTGTDVTATLAELNR